MSTNIPSSMALTVYDPYRTEVHALATESAFFGALSSLIDYRRATEGLTKCELAERLGKDKGTVTKLTSRPTNMKISTLAAMGDALNAHVALVFVARENTSVIFTSTGMRTCGLAQVSVTNARHVEQRIRPKSYTWIESAQDTTNA